MSATIILSLDTAPTDMALHIEIDQIVKGERKASADIWRRILDHLDNGGSLGLSRGGTDLGDVPKQLAAEFAEILLRNRCGIFILGIGGRLYHMLNRTLGIVHRFGDKSSGVRRDARNMRQRDIGQSLGDHQPTAHFRPQFFDFRHRFYLTQFNSPSVGSLTDPTVTESPAGHKPVGDEVNHDN
jgi:hypothetical protein